MGSQQQKNPHPTLNLGYLNFEKRVQAISIDGIFSQKNLSKQSQNEDIPGTAAKKEDQLEIVGSNKNIFAPKNTVP